MKNVRRVVRRVVKKKVVRVVRRKKILFTEGRPIWEGGQIANPAAWVSVSTFLSQATHKQMAATSQQYNFWLRDKYKEVFKKSPAPNIPSVLLHAAVGYELQYRGFKEHGELKVLSPEFMAKREAALTFDIEAFPEPMRGILQVDKAKEEEMAKKQEKEVTKGHVLAGKTTGLTVRQYWEKVLRANVSNKQTDEQLMKSVYAEFPERPKDRFKDARHHRRKFNKGTLFEGQKTPASPSVPYDKSGEPLAKKSKVAKSTNGSGQSLKKKVVKKVSRHGRTSSRGTSAATSSR